MRAHPQDRRPNLFARTLLRLRLAEEPPAAAEDPTTVAVRLTELLEEARPVPLTHDVRLDKHAIYGLVDQVRATTQAGALLEAAEAVEDAVRNAMPVPLTDQVRLHRERVAELVRSLRLAS